jgi:hypothetical protein
VKALGLSVLGGGSVGNAMRGYEMNKGKIDLSKWLILYGVVIISFHLLPAFLTEYVQEPITQGDLLDFFTPFAVIAVASLLYSRICRIGSEPISSSGFPYRMPEIILGVGIILYVEGHGLHLSANSLARLFDRVQYPEFFNAVYFFDEIISHYVWDLGVFLISIALIFASSRIPRKSQSLQNFYLLCAGATFYGFTIAVNGIEGQTVVFAIPASLVGVIVSAGERYKISRNFKTKPVRLFFLVAYVISLLLFAYWGIRYSGFPQFSALGWI